MKLRDSQVLLECTLLMRHLNHYHSFMCTATSKSDEQNILILNWHHFIWNIWIQLKSRQLQISLEWSNFYAGINVTFLLFIIFEGLSIKFIIFIFWPILLLVFSHLLLTSCSHMRNQGQRFHCTYSLKDLASYPRIQYLNSYDVCGNCRWGILLEYLVVITCLFFVN